MKPPESHGFLRAGMFFLVFIGLFWVSIAKADGIALTVNVHEHRASPDISNVPRIRFLTTADFPPFSFADAGGKIAGFNVDLVREICRELNVEQKCQIQVLPFDELQSTLDARAWDAVIAGVAVTRQMRQQYEFSRPYLTLPARFSVHSQKAEGLAEPADLADQDVGVIAGSVHAEMLKAFFPNLKQKPFDDRQLLLDALKKGEVLAAFGSGLQLSFWQLSADADGCCHFLGGPFYSRHFLGEGMAIMTRKGEPLSRAFDAALVALAEDGTLDELFLRYFPGGL